MELFITLRRTFADIEQHHMHQFEERFLVLAGG
jgi:hypothetical protein